MNKKHYEHILNQFKADHPYLATGIKDWSPRGEMGIRVVMMDGGKYDYYATSRTVRNVAKRPEYRDDYNEDSWRTTFADRLAEHMCAKCITQDTLAEYTGLSKGAINNYVKGKSTPSAFALTKLARALDCSVMDLTD